MDLLFTDREYDVMNILWDRGSATVREARDALDDDLVYTSVLTVFQTLEEKSHVRHEQEGKAYRYRPNVTRQEAQKNAVIYLLERFCRNSPAELVARLMESRDVDAEKLRAALEREQAQG